MSKLDIQIVYDDPSSNDAFEGQGHKRSAEALAHSIELLADRDGSIGLEGEWGSGKSTVIKLSEDILSKKNGSESKYNFSIFTFDLWAHQADEFRRAFLEEFISWLLEKDSIKKNYAEDKRKLLRGKEKIIEHRKNREFNWLAIALILLSPFLPIAYLWLNPLAFRDETGQIAFNWGAIHPFTYISFILVLIPAVLFIIAAVFEMFKNNYEIQKSLSSVISGFSKESDNITTNEYIRDKDPTTIEFNKIFRELLSKVQNNTKHRLVIVLDNIDRVSTESIPLLWSELRSLYSTSQLNDDKLNNPESYVTTVVPYDRSQIIQALSKQTKDNGEKNTPVLLQEKPKEAKNDTINKTFSRVLRVSPPILTDWQEYMTQCFEKASFPSALLDDKIQYSLFKLLDLHLQIYDLHPTPRRIIAYVNEIGVLLSQWNNVIDVRHIALYTLHKSILEDRPSALANYGTIDRRYHSIVGEPTAWSTDIAAILFNVSPSRADQVFLDSRIRDALVSDTSLKLKELSKLAGFEARLMDVLSKQLADWAPSNVILISKAAKNLASKDIHLPKSYKHVWACFKEIINNISNIDTYQNDILDGMREIILHQDEQLQTPTATNVASRFSTYIESDNSANFDEGANWLKAIKHIYPSNLENIAISISLPDSASFQTGVASFSNKEQLQIFRKFKKINLDGVIQELTRLAPIEPDKTEEVYSEIKDLIKSDNESLKEYKNEIQEQLIQAGRKNNASFISPLLKSFISVSKKIGFQPIKSLSKDGTWIGMLKYFYEQEHFEEAAICFFNLIESQSGVSLPSLPENHPTYGATSSLRNWYQNFIATISIDDSFYNTLADLIYQPGVGSTWAQYAINNPQTMFSKTFEIVVQKKGFVILNPEAAIKIYPQVLSLFGEEFSLEYLRRISGHSKYMDDYFKGDKATLIPSEVIYNLKHFDANHILRKTLVNLIDDYLKGLSPEKWSEAFVNESEIIRVLIARKILEQKFTLPVANFREPVLEHIYKVIEGKTIPKIFFENWKYIAASLPPSTYKKLSTDIVRQLPRITSTDDGIKNFVLLYVDIAKNTPWAKFPDISIEYIFSKIIYSKNEQVINFVLDKADDFKESYLNSTDDIKGIMQDSIHSIEDEVLRKKIITLLGIEDKSEVYESDNSSK